MTRRLAAFVSVIVTFQIHGCATPADNAGRSKHQLPDPISTLLKETSDPTARYLLSAFGTIQNEYVDVVDEVPVIEACRNGMAKAAARLGEPVPAFRDTKAGMAGLRQMLSSLEQARTQSQGRASDEKIADACLHEMMANLAGSAYIDRAGLTEMTAGGPPIAAIGVEIVTASRPIVVKETIENSPARRAQLQKDDMIVAIDGEPTHSLDATAVISRLRGAPGSAVRLTIERPGVAEKFERTLIREVINVKTVTWTMLPSQCAYIRISLLHQETIPDLAEILSLVNQKSANALILDLRNNTGGLLTTSIGVASAFLPKGTIIGSTQSRNEDSRMTFSADKSFFSRNAQDPYANLPAMAKTIRLVVLVNHATASGAEIIAAALQDAGRATLIGKQTYGQEGISTIYPTRNGSALRLKTARVLRANGAALGKGVTPDLWYPLPDAVHPISEIASDPVVKFALEFLGLFSSQARKNVHFASF